MKEFEEKDAVAAMRATLSAEASKRINDDELLNIIDIIWDWYDDQGLLEIEADPDTEEINVEALVSYVRKTIAKDKMSPVTQAEVEPLVAAELSYEQSLES